MSPASPARRSSTAPTAAASPTSGHGAPSAHRTTTVAGFPNLFVLGGPNFATGHMSVVEMFEHQYDYIFDALRKLDELGLASLEVKAEAQARFNAELDRKMERTVWVRGGCSSWYLDRSGRNSTLWPDWTFVHAGETRELDLDEYAVVAEGERRPSEDLVAA